MPKRLPAESASVLWTLTLRGGEPKDSYAISIVTNGGMGARPGLDGLSATSFPSAVRGSPVEIIESTWGNSVLDLQANKIDIMFGLSPTPSRALILEFTRL